MKAKSEDISTTVVALTGGVGGAKLADGLANLIAPDDLTLIVNTGDDFEHLGLMISPDVDTLIYTLAGLADPNQGWGRAGETWQFMQALKQLGGETWFQLGDADLAMHVERTRRLAAGESLTEVIASICRRLGIQPRVLPMSDDPVRTRVETADGWLAFQDYFVRLRCEPEIQAIEFSGLSTAQPASGVIEALSDPACEAIVICPSNPWLSVDPMLAIPGIRKALVQSRAPVVAVSPLIAGKAVKGPTAKLMAELGLEVNARSVLHHYKDFVDIFVVDEGDADELREPGLRIETAPILMRTSEDRIDLARRVVEMVKSA